MSRKTLLTGHRPVRNWSNRMLRTGTIRNRNIRGIAETIHSIRRTGEILLWSLFFLILLGLLTAIIEMD